MLSIGNFEGWHLSTQTQIHRFSFLYIVVTSIPQIRGDFAELFEGGFEIFDDLLGENIGIGEIVGFFEAFVAEPEDVRAGKKTTDPLTRLRFLCRGVPVVYTVYRIVSVVSCPLVVSLKTESPTRIILLITSQQTGIL